MRPMTSGAALMAVSVENRTSELEDVDALVERYRARILRFIFASVRDMNGPNLIFVAAGIGVPPLGGFVGAPVIDRPGFPRPHASTT